MFGVDGLGLRVEGYGLGSRVKDFGLGGVEFRVQNLGVWRVVFRVWCEQSRGC